jgi:hypothetical protein
MFALGESQCQLHEAINNFDCRFQSVLLLRTEASVVRRKENDATTKSFGPSAGYFECFVSKYIMTMMVIMRRSVENMLTGL